MLGGGQDVVVTLQMVGIKGALAVGQRDATPKQTGGRIVARTQRVGDDLAGASAERQPQPDHPAPAVTDEGPQLVQFQNVIRLGGGQGRLQGRQAQGFFLSQAVTVLRDTPKVRLSPRKLLRS